MKASSAISGAPWVVSGWDRDGAVSGGGSAARASAGPPVECVARVTEAASLEELVTLGHEVTIFDNLTTGYRSNLHPQARFVEGDICGIDKLTGLATE